MVSTLDTLPVIRSPVWLAPYLKPPISVFTFDFTSVLFVRCWRIGYYYTTLSWCVRIKTPFTRHGRNVIAVSFQLRVWGDFRRKNESGNHKRNKFPLIEIFLLIAFLLLYLTWRNDKRKIVVIVGTVSCLNMGRVAGGISVGCGWILISYFLNKCASILCCTNSKNRKVHNGLNSESKQFRPHLCA